MEHPITSANVRDGKIFVESWYRYILGDLHQFDRDGGIDMEGIAFQNTYFLLLRLSGG